LIKSIHRRHWLSHLVCKATRHRVKHHWLGCHLVGEELLWELLWLLYIWYLLWYSLVEWLLLLARVILDQRYLLGFLNWGSLHLSLLLLVNFSLLNQLGLFNLAGGHLASWTSFKFIRNCLRLVHRSSRLVWLWLAC
jgi:hypothetical protein